MKRELQEIVRRPIPAELGDLARIMHIIKSLKIATILEFGSGKSTVCFFFCFTEEQSQNMRISYPLI